MGASRSRTNNPADDERVRGGTRLHYADGSNVEGEFNTATKKPLGSQPGNKPLGLTSDAEWARNFPGSATGQRMNPPPMAGTVNQQGPTPIRKIGPSAGYLPEDVSKMVQANPTGAASFQTPWGLVSRGATPTAIPANPARMAAPSPAVPPISPATNVAAGPMISQPSAQPQPNPGASGAQWLGAVKQGASRVGSAVASGARSVARGIGNAASAVMAPAKPLVEGAKGVAAGVQAAKPLWAPVASAVGRAMTPQAVSAGRAGQALWNALPAGAQRGAKAVASQVPGAALSTALPLPLGALWSLGRARKKATPINRPEYQPAS